VRVDRGPAEIHRLQQQRAAVVSANLKGRGLGKAVGDIEAAVEQNPPPPGVAVEMGGQNEEMRLSFASLRFALALAIFLVYFVMAATFESLIHPFIVMFTIPLALVGVVIGLVVTSTPISVIVLIGTVMLVGIVVNNAIILIDYIDILRSRDGMDRREALVQGGKTRFRPVVLTALTTALGLTTLAVGMNFDFFGLYRSLEPDFYMGGEQAAWWGPMAVAIIAGILIATFLTLILVPVMYSLTDDVEKFFRLHFLHREELAAAGPPAHTIDRRDTAGRPRPDFESPEPVGAGARGA